jgi:ribosome-associated translation inhibitor RaiA/DNA-directed RNA polymerase specialized sigma24 family protein
LDWPDAFPKALLANCGEPMKHTIEFKDCEASAADRKVIEDLIKRLDRKTRIFSPDEVFLRLKVEHNQAHKLYSVVLTLDLPGKILAAREQKRQAEPAIRTVFAEIDRQLAEYKAALRGEHFWKRLTRLEELRQLQTKAAPPDPESFFALVNPHLPALNDFVAHELFYAEATGDLASGELTAEDLVDLVLLRAHQEFVKDPARGDIKEWLIRHAKEQLDSEIKRSISERTRIPDVNVPTPEQEVESRAAERFPIGSLRLRSPSRRRR